MMITLLNGMFQDPTCWACLSQQLRKSGLEHSFISLYPGNSKLYNFQQVVTHVENEIIKLKDEKIYLISHSLGAMVTEKILRNNKNIVPILINPSPSWGYIGPIFPLVIAAKRGVFWKKRIRLTTKESQELLFQEYSLEEIKEKFQIQAESGKLLREVFWFFDLIGQNTKFERDLERDVHIFTGCLDPISTVGYCSRLGEMYRNARLHTFENVGHMAIYNTSAMEQVANYIASMYRD